MDWHGLIGVGLLTIGGGIFGLTLFQAVGGRLRPSEAGAQVATSLGTILVGLAMQPGIGAMSTPLLTGGGAALISGSLLTARHPRHVHGASDERTRRLS